MTTNKMLCRNHGCDWRGSEGEILIAPNPFDPSDSLEACPQCKSVRSLVVVCDEPDCWIEATCGTPTKHSYRWTCSQHQPVRES